MIFIDTAASVSPVNNEAEIMNRKKQVKLLIRDHQTRQHLADLPAHLYQDIGKSQPHIDAELNKQSLLGTIFNCVRSLVKGA